MSEFKAGKLSWVIMLCALVCFISTRVFLKAEEINVLT